MGRIAKIFCAVTALMLSMMCIYAIKPDMIVSWGVVSSYEDLSAAHGEGYMQGGITNGTLSEIGKFIRLRPISC